MIGRRLNSQINLKLDNSVENILMTSNRAKTIPDDFSHVLLHSRYWSDRTYAQNRVALTQTIRRGTAFKGDWHEVLWELQLPFYSDPPDSYRLMLKAGDRRVDVLLSIVYGEQSAALLTALQDYSGSADYIGFLERLLTTQGVQIFNLKTYRYYWKGLRGYASKQVLPSQAIQLFSPPTHFEPISWIDFESADWVEQNAALPSTHSRTVYQRWLPLMPPDFNPQEYRSLYDMLFYLIGDPSLLDAAEVADGYPFDLLPLGGEESWFLSLWEQVSDLFTPGAYIILQDDGNVFWKIEFTPSGLQFYREKL